ncbi:hypothetical protein N2152v2_003717 [Parachlorella kessleri]
MVDVPAGQKLNSPACSPEGRRECVTVCALVTLQFVFALTTDVDGFDGGPLWRSDNYGSPNSWEDMTQKMTAALPPGQQTDLGVVELHWHADKPERILFQGKGRFHFVSTDYGATVKALATPKFTQGFPQDIRVHPRQTDWVLAKVRRDECMLDRHSTLCAYDLFLSKDFAVSWTNLTEQSGGRISSFRDYDWGAKMAMFAGKPTPDETIFATVYQSSSSQKGLYPGWDKDLHYVVSTDFFKSVKKQIPCGNLFEIVAHKVFLAVPSDCPLGPDGRKKDTSKHTISGRTVTMYVSDWDGDDFTEACLPANLEDDGYNLVHTHDDYGAFILADHAEEGSRGPTSDSPVSDLYAPAYNATFYTLSMRNVYRRDFIVDFTRLEALPGVYVANVVDQAALGPDARGRPNQFLKTMVTFNGGATWDFVPPPASFRYAQCNTCPPGSSAADCRLHLHGPTSWFSAEGPRPNVYAHPSAPGLVLATGNVGAHLDYASSVTCTYLSRDGGLTWEDVLEGPAIYEVGAHGDLVAMSPHKSEGPTDTVLFSLDHGLCWNKVSLPEAITVDNIRQAFLRVSSAAVAVAAGVVLILLLSAPSAAGVDASGGGHVFVAHGHSCTKNPARPACTWTGGGTPPAKMYVIDVKDLMREDLRECGAQDYEPWRLLNSDACLLGNAYTMQRRKRSAGCASAANYQPPPMEVAPCNCTVDADAECEFGYSKVKGSCVPMPGLEDVNSLCPSFANSGYKMSASHLRLVHADQCANSRAIIPDTDGKGDWSPSGGSGHGSSGSGWKRFFLMTLLLGGALTVAGVAWVFLLPAGLKEDILDKVSPLLGLLGALLEKLLDVVISAWDWLRGKLTGTGGGSGDREARAAYFEPLTDRLELDPEDHTSPPLFGNQR